MKTLKSILLICLLTATLPLSAAEKIENSFLQIRTVEEGGQTLGFDLLKDGKLIAPVRFSSNKLLRAAATDCIIELDKQTLRFHRFKPKGGCGLKLSPDDFVSVTLFKDDPYPLVRFRFSIHEFHQDKWERAAGRFPFHFLSFYMPRARVFHQRGWIMPTPPEDPFPLLLDVHVNTPQVCSYWSRNWSYAPPIGAYPIPVIGLWSPDEGLYVGYEFLNARLTDHSERYIATAYCYKEGKDSQFATLVFPFAIGYQELTYPATRTRAASHFRIVYSTNLRDTDDANAFLQEYFFRRYRRYFPRVPRMNDMSFVPGAVRLKDFPDLPRGRLVIRQKAQGRFTDPNCIQIGAWRWHTGSPVRGAIARNDKRQLQMLKEDVEYLLSVAEKTTVRGEQCLFWSKPIVGKWQDKWGGEPVKTLHNTNGWAAGIVLVDLYREEKDPRYLEAIDGIYNWTKHFLWTRNEFADVPSSPFAIGCTLSCAFLLDYYYTFKNDPARRECAEAALPLARNILYRYLPIWVCDNDPMDNLDSSFLMEPNSGRNWTGSACANEVHWVIDTMTEVYVNTGDPILNYYLRGILQRWYQLYRDEIYDSLADYPRAFSEHLPFFDGTVFPRGQRVTFGSADSLRFNQPIGDSLLRVTCGCKAAFACNKKGIHTFIKDYRYAPDGNFSLAVESKLKEPFDASITFPFYDISAKPVFIIRGGKRRKLTQPTEYYSPKNDPESLYVRNLRSGDVVIIGDVPQDSPVLNIGNDFGYLPLEKMQPLAKPFNLVRINYDIKLSYDWDDADSWAGLIAGKRVAFGVPYYIAPPELYPNGVATRKPVKVESTCNCVFAFFSYDGNDSRVQFRFNDGHVETRMALDAAVAWYSWPPLFTKRLLIAGVRSGETVRLVEVIPHNTKLFAVTTGTVPSAQLDEIFACIERYNQNWLKELKTQKQISGLRKFIEGIPKGRIAFIPPNDKAGSHFNFLAKVGLLGKSVRLRARDFVNPKIFNAKNFPIAIYSDSNERYLHTVATDGDGKQALHRYLAGGGLLVLISQGPYPLYRAIIKGKEQPMPMASEIGLPVYVAFEHPPEGETVSFKLNPEQHIITAVAAELPYPDGDQRLRPIDTKRLPEGITYIPILTAVTSDGKVYGDAAAYLEFKEGKLKGGRILYVWSSLMTNSVYGNQILGDIVKFIIEQF